MDPKRYALRTADPFLEPSESMFTQLLGPSGLRAFGFKVNIALLVSVLPSEDHGL